MLLNSEEVDTWLWEHSQIQGHVCDGVKGSIKVVGSHDLRELVNIAFVDRTTNERIDLIWKNI